MEKNSRLYVHCGLHKTGSTALQSALRASEGALRQAGFLYPYAGSLDQPGKKNSDPHRHGHHNIGFEIDRHWLFHPRLGTVSELAREIGHHSGSVIISAEAFESALAEPERFEPLQRLARETGRRLTLVVYLRNQLSYCESLYQELLKHDAGKEYRRHADEILETGVLRYCETNHQFDYERVLGKWMQVPEVEILPRNYHALCGGSIVTDFAQLLGLEGVLRSRAGEEKVNGRDGIAESLDRFYGNRTRRQPVRAEKLRIAYLAQRVSRLASSTTIQQKFAERFQASNLRLCEQWQIPIAGLDMKDMPRPKSEVTLDQFFSFETYYAIRSGNLLRGAKQTRWMTGIETADKDRPLLETIQYWLGQGARYRRWYASRLAALVPFRPSSRFS